MLAGRLRGERLADAGRAKEVDDKALAFSLHEVIEVEVCVMRLDERLKQALVVVRENEVREGLGGPLDRLDILDVEFDWGMNG